MEWIDVRFALPTATVCRRVLDLDQFIERLFRELGFKDGEYHYDYEVTHHYIYFTLSYLKDSVNSDMRGQLVATFVSNLYQLSFL